jgi:hypothetical protein
MCGCNQPVQTVQPLQQTEPVPPPPAPEPVPTEPHPFREPVGAAR